MPDYKTTYSFAAEYLEKDVSGARRKEIIEIPLISSDRFFDLMELPEIKALADGLDSAAALNFGCWLASQIVPGLIEKLSPQSAMGLIAAIFGHEKDTFGLGGTPQPTAPTPDLTPAS
jgi:hypothetical protein